LHLGVDALQRAEEVLARHAGHHEVQQHQFDGLPVFGIQLQGFGRSRGHVDLLALALQNSLHEVNALTIDRAGNVYAGIWPDRMVIRIDATGRATIVAGGGDLETDATPATQAAWYDVTALAIDPANGTLYLALGEKVRQVPGVGQGQ
jgi:hypothetical protein